MADMRMRERTVGCNASRNGANMNTRAHVRIKAATDHHVPMSCCSGWHPPEPQ
eukprot:CAMPEP_0198107934 /NCGR_PEP_ID=MMETSP1442-20131203/32_1 /TAXON_ID= /ORGANISM="Craspedostauros australis, Strain CCMP3328" /LENGTH=52 /DNA_ID=CAMNT_0043763109 /DNA_START=143 /DNA_END=298 /DNA_ORIENTATION=+